MTSLCGRGVRRAVLAVVLLLSSPAVWSQAGSVSLEDEYKKLIRVNEDVQPLGETPFGEQINLYDGSISFTQTDVSQKGNGLPLLFTRTFRAADTSSPSSRAIEFASNAFVDWDLSVPKIETLSAEVKFTDSQGHQVDLWTFIGENDRCTRFKSGGTIFVPTKPGQEPVDWEPNVWWHGYQLEIPGEGSQDLLLRDAGNNHIPQMQLPDGSPMVFPVVTKKHWAIGCLPATDNGQPGEGFLAVAPDGNKYYLTWLIYKDAPAIAHPGGGALKRRVASMLARRVEDRFGNWLQYSYDAQGNLTTIDASDGRQLTIAYEAWQDPSGYYPVGYRATSATLQTAAGARQWRYFYSADTSAPRLITVQQPDGSAWSLDMAGIVGPQSELVSFDGCLIATWPQNATSSTATLRHPSGLTGRFTLTSTIRGRSYVPKRCILERGVYYIGIPSLFVSASLTQKVFSGAGMPDRTWNYAYSPSNESWAQDCGSCGDSVWTDVTDPDGRGTRYTFSNRFDRTESLLKRVDYYGGGVGTDLQRSEISSYATAGPWPAVLGDNLQFGMNFDQSGTLTPVGERTLQQDQGDAYTWRVTGFDGFARPIQVQRFSNVSGQAAVEEKTSLLDDYPHWVLGLPLQVDNLTTGETVSRNEYDLGRVTLSRRWHFGQLAMSYAFNAQGQLASFTDGNTHTTTLSDYKRGIPQTIGYPDGTSQHLAVDDFGQIASITDQAGSTTSYGYDAVGRVTSIVYPAGDEAAWHPKTFAYDFVLTTERGIGGGHWRRTVSKGDSRVVSYFDVMLRPVLVDTYIASDGNSHISARSDYDWKGQKTFASYPVAGQPDLGAIGSGVFTAYDALGRVTRMQQSAETGSLTTSTAYLPGAGRQVTDAKGYVTTTRYQVFDQPNYDAVVSVQAPEGVSQSIVRDLYGNPTAIRQWGSANGYVADVTKQLYYDTYHRLCRTWEPESGSEVTAYDAANNVDWTASGLSITGTACGQEQVAEAAKTRRTYDPMNRLEKLLPPTGTQSTLYTYDALGNVKQADSGITSWVGERNKLGQLTAETLSVIGNGSNVIRYAHDSYGNLRSIAYPDATVVDYAPDPLGRPTQAGSYATGVSYHPDGEIAHFVYGNGAEYLAQKNARQLISNFTYAKGGTINLSEDFAYDNNGNISSITDLAGGPRSKSFGYDALNRLASARADRLWGTETYQYDPLNNIRNRGGAGQSLDYNYDATNRLTGITQAGNAVMTLGYDARGNVTSRNGNTLVFDEKNQLTSIPGYDTYAYDAAGRRVLKAPANGSNSTYYFYTQEGRLLYQYDATTTKTTDYIYLGKKLIARAEGSTSRILGHVDGVSVDASGNNASITGWACSSGLAQSIAVHLYVGGPYGTGTMIGGYTANAASEAAVATACGVSSGSYRFVIPLTSATRSQYAGQKIYIHGISPVGNDNSLVADSGVYSVPALPTAPAAPASISADKLADLSRINVSWSSSSGTTSYKLQKQFNGGAWADAYSGAATAYAIDNPADGSYVFQAQACNAVGCSAWAASGAVTIAHIPPTPAWITVPASSNGPVSVSWASSAYATYYDLYQSINGGGWTRVYSGPSTNVTVNATVSGSYTFFVAAGNTNGWSGNLAGSSAVAVTIPPSGSPSISVPVSSNSGAYTVSWSGVGGAASYTLVEQANGGGWMTVQANGNTSWSTSGKGNGTYGYMVQACNAGGCGPWSGVGSISVALVPPMPTNVQAIDSFPSPKSERLTIKWNASPGATSYQVMRINTGEILQAGTATSLVVENGAVGEIPLYGYQVRACNAVGCSEWAYAY
ncbi:chitinase N-terminal domain-containing protein [Dyella sp. BiH032]|uniref:chitinase N-terminal domain-containing protein n=1 Tax=Dyella sp. BiH032 TaxID=3075430 RepID=UPI0028934D2B|nr:chitinase N-terminal domain-containing protein [Dyella sp. BiH032]WNL47040.1 chitinase N-terminal domain-containing protein [Dyella sp. BiH032]